MSCMQLLQVATERREETTTEADFDAIIERDDMYLDDDVERIRADVRRAVENHPVGVNDPFSVVGCSLLCSGGAISQEKESRQVAGVLCAHRIRAS